MTGCEARGSTGSEVDVDHPSPGNGTFPVTLSVSLQVVCRPLATRPAKRRPIGHNWCQKGRDEGEIREEIA